MSSENVKIWIGEVVVMISPISDEPVAPAKKRKKKKKKKIKKRVKKKAKKKQ